jgi:hypothetical protein
MWGNWANWNANWAAGAPGWNPGWNWGGWGWTNWPGNNWWGASNAAVVEYRWVHVDTGRTYFGGRSSGWSLSGNTWMNTGTATLPFTSVHPGDRGDYRLYVYIDWNGTGGRDQRIGGPSSSIRLSVSGAVPVRSWAPRPVSAGTNRVPLIWGGSVAASLRNNIVTLSLPSSRVGQLIREVRDNDMVFHIDMLSRSAHSVTLPRVALDRFANAGYLVEFVFNNGIIVLTPDEIRGITSTSGASVTLALADHGRAASPAAADSPLAPLTLPSEFGLSEDTFTPPDEDDGPPLAAMGENPEANAPQNPFGDVAATDWYHNYVVEAFHTRLMTPMSSEPMLFAPETLVTRATIVSMLYNLEQAPSIEGMTNDFTDVEAGAWYADAVVWAANNGLVSGIEDGTFGPDRSISLQDLTVILNNYITLREWSLIEATDASTVNAATLATAEAYARGAIDRFINAGIISSNLGATFDPARNTTRADTAAMFLRLRNARGMGE